MQRDIQTLATCGRRLLQAKDGRGRRWPVAHCTQALIVAGTPAAIAQGCADAIARVVITVQARAAAGRSGQGGSKARHPQCGGPPWGRC